MKKFYLSKTLITNLLIAVAAFFPYAQNFISANPDVFMWGFAAINFVLRLVTKDKIQIS